MFVETVRLLIVLFATIAGFELANDVDADAAFVGALVGACSGYVVGGVLGRTIARTMGRGERRLRTRSAGQLITGAGLGAVFGVVGALGTATFLVLFPYRWVAPLAVLACWVFVAFGAHVGAARSGEILAVLGLSPKPLAQARRYGDEHPEGAMLVDTSAVMDGRLLHVARAGLARGDLLVPRFVIDELQGIADAQDLQRRRRGRRGLEILEALSKERNVAVRILDDELPEIDAVDAKLVALGRRLGVGLVTNDRALARVAELQGVHCLDLQRLFDSLRPDQVAGDVVRVEVVKAGTEPGQGVGFLPDGSMVVVGDAAELIGATVHVRIGSEVRTPRGRMFFATLEPEPGSETEAETPVPSDVGADT